MIVRRLRAFVVRVVEEVESVRGRGFVRRLSSVSSRSTSQVIFDKVQKTGGHGRLWEPRVAATQTFYILLFYIETLWGSLPCLP